MQETRVQSLGWEDALEKAISTHSSILAWRIPWTEPGGLQSMGLQRAGHDWSDLANLEYPSVIGDWMSIYLLYLSIISLSIYLSIGQVLSSHGTWGLLIFVPEGWEKNYLLGPQIIETLIPTAFFLLVSILWYVIFLLNVGIFLSFLLIAFEKYLLF